MSNSLLPLSSRSTPLAWVGVLIAGLGFSAITAAQTSSQTPLSAPQARAAQADVKSMPTTAPSNDHRLAKPGDRNCLQQTGSLIRPKNGHCLPVTGRSYSRDDLRNTGAVDNARALQMLDPSISVGH